MLIPNQVWLHFYYVYQQLVDGVNSQGSDVLIQEHTIYDCKMALSLFSSPIILSILSPYKLSADALEDIYMILSETIDPSVLNDLSSPKGDYCFSIDDDRAPSLYQFYPEDKRHLYFIDQKLILSKLRLVVNEGFKVNKILLESLALVEMRKAERFASVGEAQIISGIADSYRFLYGQFEGLKEQAKDQTALFTYSDKENKH
jgi:hypothetical protein